MKYGLIIFIVLVLFSSCVSIDYSEESALVFVLVERSIETPSNISFQMQVSGEEEYRKFSFFESFALFNMGIDEGAISSDYTFFNGDYSISSHVYAEFSAHADGLNIFPKKLVISDNLSTRFRPLEESDWERIQQIVASDENLSSLIIHSN